MSECLKKARRIVRVRKNFVRLAEWRKIEIDRALQEIAKRDREIAQLTEEGGGRYSSAFAHMLLKSTRQIAERKGILERLEKEEAVKLLREQGRLRSSVEHCQDAESQEARRLERALLEEMIEVGQSYHSD